MGRTQTRTKEEIIKHCIFDEEEELMEMIEIEHYLIVKTNHYGDIYYRGYISVDKEYRACAHTHQTLDECLIDCITCKYNGIDSSRAFPYVKRVIGM